MKKGKHNIVLVIDRSGSMSTMKNDMEGALNEFLKKQAEIKDQDIYVTYYSFNNVTEKIFDDKPVRNLDNKIVIEPNGGTALLDALNTSIDEIGKKLASSKEDERPETVMFVVVTDGEENSSYYSTRDQVMKKITHQESKYSWKFIYLGANQDAIKTGTNYGFTASASMTYNAYNTKKISSVLDSYTTAYRCAVSNDLTNGTLTASSVSFSDKDREELIKEEKK